LSPLPPRRPRAADLFVVSNPVAPLRFDRIVAIDSGVLE
jgi:hypothetical protein